MEKEDQYLREGEEEEGGGGVGCLTVWVQPTCIVKAHSWAYSKSLQCKFFHLMRSDQMHGNVWLLLMRSAPKSAAISLGSDLGVWDTLKLTE